MTGSILVLTLLMLLFSGIFIIQSCKTHYNVEKICHKTYGTQLQVIKNVTSLLGCTIVCNDDVECASVLFDVTNNVCKTNSGFLNDFIMGCNLTYAEFTWSTCKVLSNLGAFCQNTSDCFDELSTCLNGVCECGIGYSYDPGNKTCVEQCDVYGLDFTEFNGFLVAGYNSDTIESSDPKTCTGACAAAQNFTCLSAELSNLGVCYLSEETALSRPSSLKESPDYTYYQRNCA